VKPGSLDQRVTLQARSRTSDGMGGSVEVWTDTATVWAFVRPLRGSEGVASERVEATAMQRFCIRNRSDLNEDDRILWAGETYNIRHVHRKGSREMYLDIDAERGAA